MSPVGFELTNPENQQPKMDALPHVHWDQYMFQIYALIKVLLLLLLLLYLCYNYLRA
jgi:hypothetical protein